jgi:methylenetetrahydrofolate--tRNA-(uracil-5-)-methyltransferase
MAARVTIVGGGLAGLRGRVAARAPRRGRRPLRDAPAEADAGAPDGDLAELVCSNSLRGNALDQAAGLLKEEMRRLDSLVVRTADSVKVPAGSALAVDRGLSRAG